jgi:RNAse (barnase) inhibitor barstar
MTKPLIEIDGARFDSLSGFWNEISTRVIPGFKWGHNFDALNDILRGGFGTPEGGFRLRWVNFQRSEEVLGYPETIRWLEGRLQRCHPLNVEHFKEQLERARRGEGPTLVDLVITIIKIHGPGGNEHEDGVELELP